MKIICVGRNYSEHAKELNNAVPTEPIIFLKPDTALFGEGKYYLPSNLGEIHYETELVVRIHKAGKCIAKEFAHKYYDKITLGLDFTARDKQTELKNKGLPWELAKGFDNPAVVGAFQETSELNLDAVNFSMELNGKEVQIGNSQNMLFSINEIVAFVSNYFTLKTGDLIFTGTPAGVGPIAINDTLKGLLEGKEVFNLKIY